MAIEREFSAGGVLVREMRGREVDCAEWVPLAEAPKLLSYRGDKEMAAAAESSWGSGR